jgi:hypothetical protein
MCLRRAPEKYIAGAALDRAGLHNVGVSTSHSPVGPHGLLLGDEGVCLHLVHRPELYTLENTLFRELDLSSSSGEGRETPNLYGPAEGPDLNHWAQQSRRLPPLA